MRTKRERRNLERRYKIRKSEHHSEKLISPREYKKQILVVTEVSLLSLEFNKLNCAFIKEFIFETYS